MIIVTTNRIIKGMKRRKERRKKNKKKTENKTKNEEKPERHIKDAKEDLHI